MLKASHSWATRCAERVDKSLGPLTKTLPPSLRTSARAVMNSDRSWEWKHFWVENAHLWQRQFERTKALTGEWSERHDEVFEGWNKSEHAEVFLKSLNQGLVLKKASETALKVLAEQLKQLAIRHFSQIGKRDPSYKTQFELGEFAHESHAMHLGGERSIEFYTWDKAKAQIHLKRINQALDLIKTYSPDSYEIFVRFTKRIVPIKQKEFVSYSLQSLPGHSFINLYHRDDLDLMDDLLHENGHHHLNHYLILEDPLREDPDQIYYSPWRRSLRPVRGIYHAHLTFFFALKLYHDLSLAFIENRLEWPRKMKTSEIQKIFARYVEEWFMLEYTADDLKIAIQRGQIRPAGVRLLNMMEVERRKLGLLIPKALAKLNAGEKKKMKALQKTLKEQAELTRG